MCKIAYWDLGPSGEARMVLEHFDRALDDTALRQHLLLARAGTLEEAVSAAEKYSLASATFSSYPKPRESSAWVG